MLLYPDTFSATCLLKPTFMAHQYCPGKSWGCSLCRPSIPLPQDITGDTAVLPWELLAALTAKGRGGVGISHASPTSSLKALTPREASWSVLWNPPAPQRRQAPRSTSLPSSIKCLHVTFVSDFFPQVFLCESTSFGDLWVVLSCLNGVVFLPLRGGLNKAPPCRFWDLDSWLTCP